MWPRGGRTSPPTSSVNEVIPLRSNTQTLYLGPSCVLTSSITWQPSFTYPYLQIPSYITFEPRHVSRRTYYRMNRRSHPYRLGLSERMNRYSPILPSLQEAESSGQVVNAQGHRSLRRSLRIKRRNHSRNSNRVIEDEPTSSNSGELQIIPSEQWSSQSRYSWHADEPEIIITSDAQLQTDDSDMVGTLAYPSTSNSNMSLQANNDDCLRSETYYHSTVYGNSPNLTDRATQIPVEPNDNSSRDDVATVNRAWSLSGDKPTDNQSLMSHNLYRSVIPIPPLPTASLGSRQVANRLIRHARNNKTMNEKLLRCLDCGLLPTLPVTGQCGHTRCTKCIQIHVSCRCGSKAPETLLVNTVIQYILKKMFPNGSSKRDSIHSVRQAEVHDDTIIVQAAEAQAEEVDYLNYQPISRHKRSSAIARYHGLDAATRVPMSPLNQYEHARRLLSMGRYRDAAPHLARVAASGDPIARIARNILSQIIEVICEDRDPRRITRELFRSVRLQSASSWLRPSDLECVLCYHTYTRPVTTPCGHTYCKTCIERAMDYRKTCALCQRSLEGFDLSATRETIFVIAALESIDASSPQLPPDPDVIPIFVCTVAYPSIPCPLFIFDPRYWLMIRRVLESDSRKFGMVAYERDRNYSNYGTVLEVCDCVHLEDGRSFLSTVGVSRFRVIERDVRDGCDVARIQPLIDITPTEDIVIIDMRLMGSQILYKAFIWLNSMNKSVRSEIETAFGQIPQLDQVEEEWWSSPDGPAWLWWLIAILPLRSEIKVLILSTKNLLKRMMAVARTLEAIDQASITTTATSECEIRSALTNAEEWLERGS